MIVKSDENALDTIEYGIREAQDSPAELGSTIDIKIWVIDDGEDSSEARQTKSKIEDLLSTMEQSERAEVNVEIPKSTSSEILNWTDKILNISDIQNFNRVIIPGDSELSTERLREQLGISTVEINPTKKSRISRKLIHVGGISGLITVFCTTYLFYLAIGGFSGGLDFSCEPIAASLVDLSR